MSVGGTRRYGKAVAGRWAHSGSSCCIAADRLIATTLVTVMQKDVFRNKGGTAREVVRRHKPSFFHHVIV